MKALTKSIAQKLIESVEPAEQQAIEELASLGFRTTIREAARWRDAAPLQGVEEGIVPGTCYVAARTVTGKVKSISGATACECLEHARSFLDYQERRLAPEMRFVPMLDGSGAVPVEQRIAGDTEQTAARRAATERRIIGFASGVAELVDSHGDPMHEATQAAAHPTEKEQTR
jgi:hypothetical protein